MESSGCWCSPFAATTKKGYLLPRSGTEGGKNGLVIGYNMFPVFSDFAFPSIFHITLSLFSAFTNFTGANIQMSLQQAVSTISIIRQCCDEAFHDGKPIEEHGISPTTIVHEIYTNTFHFAGFVKCIPPSAVPGRSHLVPPPKWSPTYSERCCGFDAVDSSRWTSIVARTMFN